MMKLENKKLIFIDLDSTLIKTLSGGPFAKCIADMQPIWKVWNFLKDWANNDINKEQSKYIFIVSNQGGIELGRCSAYYIIAKLKFVVKALEEYIRNPKVLIDYAYCSSNDKNNIYRKPNTGMYDIMMVNKHQLLGSIEKDQMLMIGDACPKEINPNSFSDSDYMFAKNLNIDYLDVTQI